MQVDQTIRSGMWTDGQNARQGVRRGATGRFGGVWALGDTRGSNPPKIGCAALPGLPGECSNICTFPDDEVDD